jgi:hypothetical protein
MALLPSQSLDALPGELAAFDQALDDVLARCDVSARAHTGDPGSEAAASKGAPAPVVKRD